VWVLLGGIPEPSGKTGIVESVSPRHPSFNLRGDNLMARNLMFTLSARLAASLYSHEQEQKSRGFEMRGEQDRAQLESDHRLRRMVAVTKSVMRKETAK